MGASKKHYAERRPCTKAVHSCMSPFSGSGSRTGYTNSWWEKWEEMLASVELEARIGWRRQEGALTGDGAVLYLNRRVHYKGNAFVKTHVLACLRFNAAMNRIFSLKRQ